MIKSAFTGFIKCNFIRKKIQNSIKMPNQKNERPERKGKNDGQGGRKTRRNHRIYRHDDRIFGR